MKLLKLGTVGFNLECCICYYSTTIFNLECWILASFLLICFDSCLNWNFNFFCVFERGFVLFVLKTYFDSLCLLLFWFVWVYQRYHCFTEGYAFMYEFKDVLFVLLPVIWWIPWNCVVCCFCLFSVSYTSYKFWKQAPKLGMFWLIPQWAIFCMYNVIIWASVENGKCLCDDKRWTTCPSWSCLWATGTFGSPTTMLLRQFQSSFTSSPHSLHPISFIWLNSCWHSLKNPVS